MDGSVEARQAHGWTVSFQLCRTTQRRLSTMGAQWQRRKHIQAEQCPGAAKASTAEAEEHLQEALHGLCSCRRTKSCCCCAREAQGRHQLTKRQCQDQVPLLVDEAVVYRESREPTACVFHKKTVKSSRSITTTSFQEDTRNTRYFTSTTVTSRFAYTRTIISRTARRLSLPASHRITSSSHPTRLVYSTTIACASSPIPVSAPWCIACTSYTTSQLR